MDTEDTGKGTQASNARQPPHTQAITTKAMRARHKRQQAPYGQKARFHGKSETQANASKQRSQAMPDGNPPTNVYPPEFKAEMVAKALDWVAEGNSLRKFVEANNLKYVTLWEWIEASGDGVHSPLTRARAVGTNAMADKALEEIESTTTENAPAVRVKVDGYLRLAGKWNQKDYGDKQQVEHTHLQKMPDWSRLSEGARLEVMALLEADVAQQKQLALPAPKATDQG